MKMTHKRLFYCPKTRRNTERLGADFSQVRSMVKIERRIFFAGVVICDMPGYIFDTVVTVDLN